MNSSSSDTNNNKYKIVAGTTAFCNKNALSCLLAALNKQSVPIAAVVVVDNSPTPLLSQEEITKLIQVPVKYIWLSDNPGLATAMQQIAVYGQQVQANLLWFFDQDSNPLPNTLEKLLAAHAQLSQIHNKIMLVPTCVHSQTLLPLDVFIWGKYGLIPAPSNHEKNLEINAALTAGILISPEAFTVCTPKESFFLDSVDFDFCMQLCNCGYRIFQIHDAKILHGLGNPKEVRLISKVFVPNYPSLRWYYYTRNLCYLEYNQVKGKTTKLILLLMHFIRLKSAIKDDLFSHTFPLKTLAAILGFIDAIIGRLGKIFPQNWNIKAFFTALSSSLKQSVFREIMRAGAFAIIVNFTKIITGFIINKTLAILLGPSGLAIVGQFQSITNLTTALSIGGTGNGVVTQIASLPQNSESEKQVFRTSIYIAITFSAIIVILLAVFAKTLATSILHYPDSKFVFWYFSLSVFPLAFNTLNLCFANGRKDIRFYTVLSVLNNTINLISLVLLVSLWKLPGALASYALFPIVLSMVSWFFVAKKTWFNKEFLLPKLYTPVAKKLLKFSFTSLTSLLAITVAQIWFRTRISQMFSLTEAGYWQGLNKTSDIYMGAITLLLPLHYLPKFSSLKNESEVNREIISSLKILLPTLALVQLTIFLFKTPCIYILFSRDFLPMQKLFGWQLIGDWFRFICLFFAHVAMARSRIAITLVFDLIFCVLWILSLEMAVPIFGFQGIAMAWTFGYACVCVGWLVLFRRSMNAK